MFFRLHHRISETYNSVWEPMSRERAWRDFQSRKNLGRRRRPAYGRRSCVAAATGVRLHSGVYGCWHLDTAAVLTATSQIALRRPLPPRTTIAMPSMFFGPGVRDRIDGAITKEPEADASGWKSISSTQATLDASCALPGTADYLSGQWCKCENGFAHAAALTNPRRGDWQSAC